MIRLRAWLLIAAVMTAATSATAGISVYTDRAMFESATDSTTVEDFTDTYHYPIKYGILNYSLSDCCAAGPPLRRGDILRGVTYKTPRGTGNFFNIDVGAGYVGGFLDGGFASQGSGPQLLTVIFDAPQDGFGFDTADYMQAFTITIYLTSGQAVKESFPAVAGFYGFGSSAYNISRLTLQSDVNGGFDLDNFTYNDNLTPQAIPEPETWLYIVLGAVCVGAAVRRGRSADRAEMARA